ncbi:MAG TPA: indole-3-glycerol-phosphate synthase TrpC [Leptospiraceae bacterium]|nr:indole-3-glycerol phosphate synthase [Spirochaetaceae bacterium]HBS04244.1 indole-3-glycerol-phosphate synthase TrpC [Leptospiraceae bacterium]|tara:strand:- start:52657 stop:53487 length:831 start_codon:yes stop_codon:yes gene_type:complete
MTSRGSSLLDRIVARKRKEIENLEKSGFPSSEDAGQPRDFLQALKNPGGRLRNPGNPGTYLPLQRAIISESKKASPSMGLIRPDYDPASIAETYASLGASCISVLTDEEFFQGHLDHLKIARSAGIPVLRKDFLIHRLQIQQARAAGADSVLLIVRLLDDATLTELLDYARSMQMEPLVEVHSESEMIRACDCGARIIGINHRDLDTLEMDLSLSRRLAPELRKRNPDSVLIAESGIEKAETLEMMSEYADAFLIGTSLMRSPSIETAWKSLFGSF